MPNPVTTVLGFFLVAVTMPMSAVADNPWNVPTRSYPPFGPDQREAMDDLMRPCVDRARITFADAVELEAHGLPKGARLIAVIGQDDPYVYTKNLYVEVRSARKSTVKGIVRDEFSYRNGERIEFPVDQIGDWFITYTDRPSIGHWRSKYLLLRQDGLVTGACDPDHPEFQRFRVFRESYSFAPPMDDDWAARGEHITDDGKFFYDSWMQQEIDDLNQVNMLSSLTWRDTPHFETAEDLVDFIVKTERGAPQTDHRYTRISYDIAPYEGLDTKCVVTEWVVGDNQALLSRQGKRGPAMREGGELRCIHPTRNDLLIELAYRHRYATGNRDPEFDDKRQAVFSSVAFTDLPPVKAQPMPEPVAAEEPPVSERSDTERANELYESLMRLGDLRDKGILTDEEFEQEKKRIMGKD